MSHGNLKEAVRNFWIEVFNKGNLAPIDELIALDYTFNGQAQTRDQLKQWVGYLRGQLEGLTFTIQDLLQDGDKVAVRWTLVGKSSGTEMTNSGTNILTFQNGMAVTNWQNGGTPADLHPVTNPPLAS